MEKEGKKQKIAVVFTGGTIGSKVGKDGWIAPNREQPYALLALFRKKYPETAEGADFDCSMPYQILSEQLNADYLNLLIQEVDKLLEQKVYDAIIICHGTDTLQYTAAMLGMIFQNSGLPIYLVSSNYPLEDERANGLYNFLYAIKSIKLPYTGVLVPYRNSDGNTYLHQGIKLLAHQVFEDDLFSIHQEVLGFYDRNGVWLQKETDRQRRNMDDFPQVCSLRNLQREKLAKQSVKGFHLKSDTSSILWLRMYPGFQWGTLTEHIKYIILESYHSGTICMDEGVKDFLRQAAQYHIPVYITGLERITDSYETIKHYEESGLQPVLHVAPIALYCYLWLAISCS